MDLLVAFDGSDPAENALAYASDIVDATDGSLTLVNAVNPNVYEEGRSEPVAGPAEAEGNFVAESVEAAGERGQAVLEDGIDLARDLGHEADGELLYGDPVTAITDFAEAADLDTIVIGHRGRTGRAGVLLGSVAKQVVERSTVPVTVVR